MSFIVGSIMSGLCTLFMAYSLVTTATLMLRIYRRFKHIQRSHRGLPRKPFHKDRIVKVVLIGRPAHECE